MGLLDTVGIDTSGGLAGMLGRATTRTIKEPKEYAHDFPGGLRIMEYVNGAPDPATEIVLQGSFMPTESIKLGAEQKISKQFYAGNSEPSVQVLGLRQDDLPLKGTFKLKRLVDQGATRKAAQVYQQALEEMIERGNLVRITLGEIKRYGFLTTGRFEFMRLQEIKYDLNMAVVSKRLPSNCKQLKGDDTDVLRVNQQLLQAVSDQLASYRSYPSTMPRTLGEFLNDQISIVAGAIKQVTDFVDGIFQTATEIQQSASRGLGLIKNARSKISVYQRRLGSVPLVGSLIGGGGSRPGAATVYRYNNADHILGSLSVMTSLSAILARLQARFAALAATLPLRRVVVKEGDTLQKLAVTYYQDAEGWEKIYTHNKLTSTELTRGAVLEIPRK